MNVPQIQRQRLVCFCFHGNDFSGELIDSPEGTLEWIPDEKILGLNLWESDHIFYAVDSRKQILFCQVQL